VGAIWQHLSATQKLSGNINLGKPSVAFSKFLKDRGETYAPLSRVIGARANVQGPNRWIPFLTNSTGKSLGLREIPWFPQCSLRPVTGFNIFSLERAKRGPLKGYSRGKNNDLFFLPQFFGGGKGGVNQF